MSFATYSALQTSIASWLEREDLTATIPDFISLAEARMNRDLRVNRMLTRATATISDGFSAVPTDFLAPRSMRDSDNKLLAFVTPEQMATIKEANTSGALTYYALVGTEFEYAPVPTDGEVVSLTYYAKIPALTDANTSNWVLASHADAYLRGALLEAALYLRNSVEAAEQKGLFDEALESIRRADRHSSFAANITPAPGITTV